MAKTIRSKGQEALCQALVDARIKSGLSHNALAVKLRHHQSFVTRVESGERRISERFGYVAFAGLGGGGKNFGDLSMNNEGSAIDIGLRYRIAKKFGLDYAVDYATNASGESFLYLTIGQSF